MNKWLQLSLLLCGWLISNFVMATTHSTSQPLDHIVAIVNNTVITQSELDQIIATTKKRLLSSHTPLPPNDTLQKQVLDQLINKKLQFQLATQANMTVSDADITKTIATIARENKMTVAELNQQVMKEGLTLKEYRDEIRDEILLQKIQQQEVGSKINLNAQEVDDFMRSAAWQAYNSKEYHLEDILIALPDTPSSQDVAKAKQRAETLVIQLRQGMSFRVAAVSESGSNKALEGGDLGWRKLPEIPSAFAVQLIRAKENDILGPLQTPNGYHILHVAGIRSVNIHGDASSQRKQVEELIYQRKYEEALQAWITKIRGEAFINLHPDNFE